MESRMQFNVGRAALKNDSSFEIVLRFENVQGAAAAVDTINSLQDTVRCPSAFNGLQLAGACMQLASAVYGAIKAAKPF
ncbi:hypothetical protein IJT17_06230 [bacterium]|nr:hypothetical protein [bacterium]